MKILTLLTLIALGSAAVAADNQFEQLQAQYNQAVKRAVEPLTKVYVDNLNKMAVALLQSPSARENSATVAAITAELSRIKGTPVQITAQNDPQVANEAPAASKHYVGKSWVSDSGTTWKFDRNGAGTKTYGTSKVAFTWRVVPSGLVEVTGRDTPQGAAKVWYFKFDKTTASYGSTEDNLTASAKLKN